MYVKVLKPFPYAHDHHNIDHLVEGSVVLIDDAVAEGLEAEGFIGEATAEEIEAAQQGEVVVVEAHAVEIPEGFETMKAIALQALARKLGAPTRVTKPQALELIRAEIARRAAV